MTTLTAGRDRSEILRGMRLYTSPVVFHLAVVFVLSGAGMAPALSALGFGILCGVAGAVGTVVCIRIAIGINRSAPEDMRWFDVCWYGIVPALLYLVLLGFGLALAGGCDWGAAGVAASLIGILLASIHLDYRPTAACRCAG